MCTFVRTCAERKESDREDRQDLTTLQAVGKQNDGGRKEVGAALAKDVPALSPSSPQLPQHRVLVVEALQHIHYLDVPFLLPPSWPFHLLLPAIVEPTATRRPQTVTQQSISHCWKQGGKGGGFR